MLVSPDSTLRPAELAERVGATVRGGGRRGSMTGRTGPFQPTIALGECAVPPPISLGPASAGITDATALGAAADGEHEEQGERVLAELDAVLRRLIAGAIAR